MQKSADNILQDRQIIQRIHETKYGYKYYLNKKIKILKLSYLS